MAELQPGLITIADLFREISGMRTDLAKGMEKINLHAEKLAVQEYENRNARQDLDIMESRIRSLERFKWTILGAAGVIGISAGIIADVVIKVHGLPAGVYQSPPVTIAVSAEGSNFGSLELYPLKDRYGNPVRKLVPARNLSRGQFLFVINTILKSYRFVTLIWRSMVD